MFLSLSPATRVWGGSGEITQNLGLVQARGLQEHVGVLSARLPTQHDLSGAPVAGGTQDRVRSFSRRRQLHSDVWFHTLVWGLWGFHAGGSLLLLQTGPELQGAPRICARRSYWRRRHLAGKWRGAGKRLKPHSA